MEVAEKMKVKENGTNDKKSLLIAKNAFKNLQLEDLPICYILHLWRLFHDLINHTKDSILTFMDKLT